MTEDQSWGRQPTPGEHEGQPVTDRTGQIRAAIGVLFQDAVREHRLDEAKAWDAVLRYAPDAAVAKLGRLLK